MTAPSGSHAVTRRVALVECEEPYALVAECLPLLDSGYDVVLCAGPRADQTCPVMDGLPCPLVGNADIVINAVADHATQVAIAEGLRSQTGDVPLAVIADDDGGGIRAQGTVRFPSMRVMCSQMRRVRNGGTPRDVGPADRLVLDRHSRLLRQAA